MFHSCVILSSIIFVIVFGCDRGGAGGGGPAVTALPSRPAYTPPIIPTDRVQHGFDLFKSMGCILCHGKAGKGGVDNRNSITGGKINGLTLVKEGYTDKQLQKKIREGVFEVKRAKPDGPVPPYRMPAHGKFLQQIEIQALASYLFSLYPKDRRLDDDWDE